MRNDEEDGLKIADMSGKTVVVTGSNTGIGEVTAREIAGAGAKVIMACRSAERAEPVAASIRESTGNDQVEFMQLDLGSLASVRDFGERWRERGEAIDVLLNNAGLVTSGETKDGFELCFGVNHLGHFLLTAELLDFVKEAAEAKGEARIVTVASRAHTRTDGIDFGAVQRPTKTTTAFPEYCVSKLANVLFSAELAKRLGPGNPIHTYSLHPGVVASDIWRRVPWPFRSLMKMRMITNEEGALTSLHCATSPEAGKQTGMYYDKSKPRKTSSRGADEALAKELWEQSEKWVGRSFFA